jgi:predicted PurR-regulated permease PerM
MVFIQFLHRDCYHQIHLIPSKLTALQCGVLEGFIIATLSAFFIGIVALCLGNHFENIKMYSLVAILVCYVAFIGFFGIGYMNVWEKYQTLIQTYRSQGLSDYEIYNLLEK